MFKCAFCRKNSVVGEHCTFVTTKKRQRSYTDEEGRVTQGWEIVQEERACRSCAEKMESGSTR